MSGVQLDFVDLEQCINKLYNLSVFIGEFIVIGILVGLALSLSKMILNNLGKTGIKFITQTMGLLLGSLAIGFIADSLKLLLPGLS